VIHHGLNVGNNIIPLLELCLNNSVFFFLNLTAFSFTLCIDLQALCESRNKVKVQSDLRAVIRECGFNQLNSVE
jgi:hypothetical protein